MKQQTIKNIKTAVMFGLISAILISMARFEVLCEDLRNNVFRLHIVANSDSDFDQTLKLKVRDAVLETGGDIFKNSTNLDSAVTAAQNALPLLQETAARVISENGCDYPVSIEIGTAYFDTRTYDAFTLPAGEYQALNVRIGTAQGKNWWCVMFPALCIPSSGARLSDVTDDESADVAEHAAKYELRFKAVEIYEQIKQRFFK